MKRKQFFTALLASAAAVKALGEKPPHALLDEAGKCLVPPYLKTGDIIGITAAAGFILQEDIEPAIAKLREWGFEIKIGNTIGKRDFTLGGTDADRASDLQQMLDDPRIKAILFARGGYGIIRIIDKLNFSAFRRRPKWLIGFSDITVMHSHINRQFNIASLHSKMCNSFPSDWSTAESIQRDTIESIGQALKGAKMQYHAPFHPLNRAGNGNGSLVGGNLKTLESLAGSKSDLVTRKKILFLEDTGEYLYSIDRMLWNLKRSGKLDHLQGLVIGGFKIKPDDPGEEFGKTMHDLVLEKVKHFNYPVCFDFPVGHQKNNYAVKCGITHSLEVGSKGTLLKEIP